MAFRRLRTFVLALVVLASACDRAEPREAPRATPGAARPVVDPPPGGGTGPSAPVGGTIGLGNLRLHDAGPPVPHARLGTIDVEGVDRAVLRRAVRPHFGEVQECYERAYARDTGLQGRLVVRLSIRADGRVARAEKGDSTVTDAPLERCVLALARTWRFEVDREVTAAFPFVLHASP